MSPVSLTQHKFQHNLIPAMLHLCLYDTCWLDFELSHRQAGSPLPPALPQAAYSACAIARCKLT